VTASNLKMRATIRRSFIAMLLWQVGNYAVPLATFPYLTRVLGPTQFGALSLAVALMTYASVLVDWGVNLSGPAAIVQRRDDPGALSELVWSTIAAKALLCIFSFALLGIYIASSSRLHQFAPVALCAWLSVIGNVFSMNWLFQGLERFASFATVSLAGRFLTLPFIFVFVKGPGDCWAAAAVRSAAAILACLENRRPETAHRLDPNDSSHAC
jgi:O-antigen/teichoic acid export membrane protein